VQEPLIIHGSSRHTKGKIGYGVIYVKAESPFTLAELAQLWGSYQNDSLAQCVMSYFIRHVEDPEIRSCVDESLALSMQHLDALTVFFNKANCPIPVGFTAEDVYPDAPPLFSDLFVLYYIQQMGVLGMNTVSVSLAYSTRNDLRTYFSSCQSEYMALFNKTTDLLLSKGLYIRSPYIPMPKEAVFVQSRQFLGSLTGKQRPLAALEAADLFSNMQRNALGRAMLTGFSQVAQSEKVRNYLIKGKGIAAKHIEMFSSALSTADLPASMTWDVEVTDSTTPPFSDKLLLFHTTALITSGLGYYGTSMATTMRKDLQIMYTRLSAEVAKYAGEGAVLMIDEGWFEEPPMVPDRDALAKKNKR
jgi:hypothetical protein